MEKAPFNKMPVEHHIRVCHVDIPVRTDTCLGVHMHTETHMCSPTYTQILPCMCMQTHSQPAQGCTRPEGPLPGQASLLVQLSPAADG